jgi:cytochrome c oxidase assembly protein subunit 15
VLGILTLVNGVPIDLALAHQAGAVLVLTLVLLQAERVNRRPADDAVPSTATMMTATGGRR